MMDAIKVENVWKKFKIPVEKRNTVFERLLAVGSNTKKAYREFWALRNVNFNVPEGEALGIIGRNWSGKSTLLRIISKILIPDRGTVISKGSMSLLLSLGVGFRPELNAEENVRLYSTVLGIKANRQRINEIFEFAELNDFRKMKLKNFSTGMYMRLAFSTIVTVDPDIILIDEVLAVGDEEFQKKCLDKMYNFKDKGKSIVFVSHALESVRNLCNRTIFLKDGEIASIGPSQEVIQDYLHDIAIK